MWDRTAARKCPEGRSHVSGDQLACLPDPPRLESHLSAECHWHISHCPHLISYRDLITPDPSILEFDERKVGVYHELDHRPRP